MGQSPDSSTYNTDKKGIPLVQGNADIVDGIIEPTKFTTCPTKVVEQGTLILSVRAPVGTVSYVDRKICIGRGVCAINSSNNDFIYQLLKYHQNTWKNIEQGGTFSAISSDDVHSLVIGCPNSDEQTVIAKYLSKIDNQISKQIEVYKKQIILKNTFLHQLFI